MCTICNVSNCMHHMTDSSQTTLIFLVTVNTYLDSDLQYKIVNFLSKRFAVTGDPPESVYLINSKDLLSQVTPRVSI